MSDRRISFCRRLDVLFLLLYKCFLTLALFKVTLLVFSSSLKLLYRLFLQVNGRDDPITHFFIFSFSCREQGKSAIFACFSWYTL